MCQARTEKGGREFSHQVTPGCIDMYPWKRLSLSNWCLLNREPQLLPSACFLLLAETRPPLRAKIPDAHTYFPRHLHSVNTGTWPTADKWDLRGSLPGNFWEGFSSKITKVQIPSFMHTVCPKSPMWQGAEGASGQPPVGNWCSQSNIPWRIKFCQQSGWAWKWTLLQLSLQIRPGLRLPPDCSLISDPEVEESAKLFLDSWPTKTMR